MPGEYEGIWADTERLHWKREVETETTAGWSERAHCFGGWHVCEQVVTGPTFDSDAEMSENKSAFLAFLQISQSMLRA